MKVFAPTLPRRVDCAPVTPLNDHAGRHRNGLHSLILLPRLVFAVLLFAVSLASAEAADPLAGDWHGIVATPQGELMLIVRFESNSEGYRGTLESPAQAPGQRIPLHEPTLNGEELTFTVPTIAARFHGRLDGVRWVGSLHQQIEMPLSLQRGLPPAAPVIDGLDGTWSGSLHRNGVDLRLVLRISTGDRGTIVQLDSPDMSAFDLPVAGFERKGTELRFEVPAASVRYEGQLSEDGRRISGPWRRIGQPEAEVTFERDSDDMARTGGERPQMPKSPFPYSAEDVRFDNPDADDVVLAGTLTLPDGDGPHPAAILISGSGPQDRNETVFGHQPFAVLADHLSRHGIAVLRYDDRGFAESTGDHGAATSADFATDALAAARYLRGRQEIDAAAIGLIGHSEGGMIAPLASAADPAIAFVVLLAGPGTSTLQLVESQRRLLGLSQGISELELERSAPVVAAINAALATLDDDAEAEARVRGLLTADALTALGVAERQRDLVLSQFMRPWYRYFLRYDAAAVLAQVRAPVLALNGSLDHQVPADENLAAIEAALTQHPDVTILKLDGLNHMFQTAATGAMGEYRDIAETFAPSALFVISDWIKARFPSPSSDRRNAAAD